MLMATLGELCFLSINIANKRLRNANVKAASILAIYSLTLPVWAILSVYLYFTQTVTITAPYLILLGIWTGVNFIHNFGFITLHRYQSLSESTAFAFAFTFLGALLVDVFVFQIEFHWPTLIGIFLTFIGGLLHVISRKGLIPSHLHIHTGKKLIIIVALCAFTIIMTTTYKQTILMQQNQMFHIAFSHTFLFMLFGALGTKAFISDASHLKIPISYILLIFVFLIIAVITASYAIAGLPLTYLVLFTLLKSFLYLVHDIWTKELKMDIKNISACGLIISGVIVINIF